MCCSFRVMNVSVFEVWGCGAWGRNAALRGSSELLHGTSKAGSSLPAPQPPTLLTALPGVGYDPREASWYCWGLPSPMADGFRQRVNRAWPQSCCPQHWAEAVGGEGWEGVVLPTQGYVGFTQTTNSPKRD